MGVAELREAFNAVAEPRYTCQSAALSYERVLDPDTGKLVEWQLLSFSGSSNQGSVFGTKSERIPAGADVYQAARATAQRLLDQGEPPT